MEVHHHPHTSDPGLHRGIKGIKKGVSYGMGDAMSQKLRAISHEQSKYKLQTTTINYKR